MSILRFRSLSPRRRLIATAATAAVVGATLFAATPGNAAGELTAAPLGWNVVGLDSNDVTAGPNQFPVGVRLCNTTGVDMPGVTATWAWTSVNTYVAVDGALARPARLIAAHSCADFYWTVHVTRDVNAYNTSRSFTITGDAGGGVTASTPTPRAIYVEHLVSQSRNGITSVVGPSSASIGDTVTFVATTYTATNGYEQIITGPVLDSSLFEVLSVSQNMNIGGANDQYYRDGCKWDNVVGSGTYMNCTTSVTNYGGKPITTTVTAKVLAAGSARISAIVDDHSGGSFHYNKDAGTGVDITLSASAPAFTLTKSADVSSYDTLGQVIHYSYIIDNTGESSLNGPFSVTDDKIASVLCPPTPTLAAGAQLTCTGSYTVTQADLDASSILNNATATDGDGNQATANLSIPAAEKPALSLTKDTATTALTSVGQTVTYTYTIRNTGNVTLHGPFSVADDKISAVDCTGAGADLAPEATTSCTGDYTVTQADLDAGSVTNTATVTDGNGNTSPPASKTVDATQNPHLTLVKGSTDKSFSKAGDVIHYTFTITNDGNVTLSGPFSVTDLLLSSVDCSSAPASLAPGEHTICTGEYAVPQWLVDWGSVFNVARASDGNGHQSDYANHEVTGVQAPALTITKTADRTTFDKVGDVIKYTYHVTNTGNQTLFAPLSVTDDKATVTCPSIGSIPDLAKAVYSHTALPASGLAPGAGIDCTASYPVTAADVAAGKVVNVATGHARTPNGTGIDSPEASATVTWKVPPASTPFTTPVDTSYTINVFGHAAGGFVPVSSHVLTPPAHGTVRQDSAGVMTYIPDTGYTGQDVYTVALVNAAGVVQVLTVYVTVTPALAHTGAADVLPLGGLALLLLGAGGTAVLVGRRRRI